MRLQMTQSWRWRIGISLEENLVKKSFTVGDLGVAYRCTPDVWRQGRL